MNTFKLIATLAILAAAFGAGTAMFGTWIWFALAAVSEPNRPPLPPLPPIVRIQGMSDLATLRVQIADSITGENDHWDARWMLHGEAVLGVDLSRAAYTSVDEKSRTATISLPVPQVIASKVDHHRSAEISVKQISWLPSPGLKRLRDEVWRHADEKIARLAQHEGFHEATRLRAEHVLNKLFQDVGWSVSYEWETALSSSAEASHIER